MGDMQIVSETPINMHQLKNELEKIKKRDKELNFRANKTEEYLHQVLADVKETDLFEKNAEAEYSKAQGPAYTQDNRPCSNYNQ